MNLKKIWDMEETFLTTKRDIFQKFLKDNKMFIDFNGAEYTLFDTNNNIINVTMTPDEMLQYIIGYNTCLNSLSEELELLKEANETLKLQNETNIKNYEKIIMDMGKDSLDANCTE